MPRALALLAVLGSGCGDPRASSSLEVEERADDVEVRAHWSYISSSVDVDIRVITRSALEGTECQTHARVSIDKAVTGTDVYERDFPCGELEVTRDGDLILLGESTGHDWSTEVLDVDTDHERIHLGPWSPELANDAGATTSYRFTLASHDCGDCDCPDLRRSAGGEYLVLPLGRYCD